VEVDPHSAEGWSQLAWMLVNDYLSHWNEAKKGPDESKKLLDRAEEAVQKALKIDPTVALAHYADGLIRRAKGNHPGALDAFDRAVQLDPNLARAWAQKGKSTGHGRTAEGRAAAGAEGDNAQSSRPVARRILLDYRASIFRHEKLRRCIVWLRKSVELMPNLWFSKAYLLSAYAHTKRHDQPEARTALGEYNNVFAGYTVQRIRDLYEKELPHTDPGVQASIQELYQGLKIAGVQER
jgi:adenylate cyclase